MRGQSWLARLLFQTPDLQAAGSAISRASITRRRERAMMSDRSRDSHGQSGSVWLVPRGIRLANGAAHPPGRATPPSRNLAAREERDWGCSGLHGVSALPVLSFGGRHRQPHLLADGARQEAAHGMGLPACSFQQFLHAGSLGAFQQVEHRRRLASVTGQAGLLCALGRLLGCLGLRRGPSLLGPNVRALCGNTSLLARFRLLRASRLAAPVASAIDLVIFHSPFAAITAVTT